MATNRHQASGEYQKSIEYLYQRINYEKIGHANYTANNYRLARMQRLLQLASNPHLDYPIVHVAGTKGKGSTATFISELLRAGGLRTGLYTSPHLFCLEERIRIDGQSCSGEELIELVDRMRWAAERLEAEGAGRATFFELTTAMGMLYFSLQKVDAAVLEVGLGGRLDSTNVCRPAMCVITSIGLDHQAQLGSTISEIASEKAGIIKPGIPIVCTSRHPDARAVVEQQARDNGSPLRLLSRDFHVHWQASTSRLPSGTLHFPIAQVQYEPSYPSQLGTSQWDLSMLGKHQADNAGAALATMDWLLTLGWRLSTQSFQAAIANTRLRARMEIVAQNPLQIIDAAHNPDSIDATLTTLEDHFPGRRKIMIFASSKDKDYRQMLGELMRRADAILLTEYHNSPRGLPLGDLFSAAEEVSAASANIHPRDSLVTPNVANTRQIPISAFPDPVQAWRAAVERAEAEDIVCATGSFFLAAELLGTCEIGSQTDGSGLLCAKT